MQPWLRQWSSDLANERFRHADEDVHFTENLARTVIEEFTGPGDVVLDPFAGYGTTLVVAGRLGRRAVGVELLGDRAELVRGRLGGTGQVIRGDARRVASLVQGPMDLCLTSPPYMAMVNHPENPLNAYETLDGDYAVYLRELTDVFAQVAQLMRPGGHVVINVGNMRDDGVFTPLAWDVAREVSAHLTMVGETFLCWDEQPEWLTGDYCLVFRRPTG
ncbi:DNA methylase [Haloactinopolyspora alba]|uniref:Methyltransferase n=1 Tax=Haloactinopolyspora alba TaxID=648780 RepID=A0A2P8DVP6_9ACTN|nr:DNA methylase [Haloactinopolyspora alba]